MTEIDHALKERFGLSEFRPWQREAIEELLHGRRRVVVIAPTGGGKSLCYQLPASILDGTTMVISPLIALMEDQVRALTARGIASTFLASTLDADELRRRERAMVEGAYRLVYVAPERLESNRFLDRLDRAKPVLVAVDEAHCISQWGHDFRPAYMRIGEVLERLAPRHVLACTATATPLVRAEIQAHLRLEPTRAAVILRGFSRPNLHLSVFESDVASARRKRLLRALVDALGAPAKPTGGAIVYAATRRTTEKTAEAITGAGWRAAAYHAGLPTRLREGVNEAFAAGRLDVVVATNAFGMGIDRSDIRTVVHVQAPGSVEAYYQEVGRAGRDGQPAHGLLLTSTGDFGLRRRLIGFGGDPEGNTRLMQQQWHLFLDLMRYVEAGTCRHDFILRYFGDDQETLGGCGHCDVCERLEQLGPDRDFETTTGDHSVLVRKALAGVARNQRRAGLTAVADMLHGTDSERLRRLGLTRLSTHGILGDRPRAWVLALLRRLVTGGFVDLTTGEFPIPFLTAAGVAVMRGEAPARVLLPPEDVGRRRPSPTRATTSRSVSVDVDDELLDRLRATRLELAKQRGVPAYIVCHDRTLLEIAAFKPSSVQALSEIHGMGPARISSYGEPFLAAVRGR